MIKRFGYKVVIKVMHVSITLCIAVFLISFKLPVKNSTVQVALPAQTATIKANSFYITEVVDNRADKNTIGLLIVPGTNMPETAAFYGGGLADVEHYLKQALPVYDNYRAVIINVKKLWVNEVAQANGSIAGKVDLCFSFGLKTGDDMVSHLVTYTGSAHYIRTANQTGVAGLSLQNAIQNAMIYFNNWMALQADTNPLLAKEVRLVFSDYQDKTEDDTIYYSAKRPLTWDDFKDKPRLGKYAAEVMPGLGYTEQTWIKKGVIYIAIAVKVYLPKSAAWAFENSKSDFALNHEQRHFDVVKLVGERFKQRLLTQVLPVMNYDGYINFEYFEAMREMERLQKLYDDETGHGINASEQQRWNSYIDDELSHSIPDDFIHAKLRNKKSAE